MYNSKWAIKKAWTWWLNRQGKNQLTQGGNPMNEFDNAMKRIADALYSAARKSGEILDNTKKSYSISSEKDKISKVQTQIGLKVYKAYLAGSEVPDYVQPEIDALKAIEDRIQELERSIAESKSYKICAECGARIAQESVYCPKCGAKLPDTAAAAASSCCEQAPSEEDSPCCCGDDKSEAAEDKPQRADSNCCDDDDF